MKKISYNEYRNVIVENMSAKILPINLAETMKRAAHFTGSNIEEMKKKAIGNLVDIHFFPVKYNKNNQNKERAYVEYNLRNALLSAIVNHENWKKLIAVENVDFKITEEDIEKTLWSVANRLSDDIKIKTDVVPLIINLWKTNDFSSIKEEYNNWGVLMDMFIGKNRYIADKISFDYMEKTHYVGVYLYGERDDAWKTVVHKNGEMCLYFTPEIKQMLKRIKNSMTGQQFHKYMNNLIGKWFDLNDKTWDCIRQNMCRISDESLSDSYTLEICEAEIKKHMNLLSKWYDAERIEEKEEFVLSNEIQKEIEEINTEYNEIEDKDENFYTNLANWTPEIENTNINNNDDVDNTQFFIDLQNEKW